MSVLILDSQIVHYEVLGRGPAVVFLHGWVGSWRYWVPSMQAVAIRYRTYALDLWGFGDTNRKEDSYTIEGQANLLEQFLDSLGLGRVAIVGHGLGALVGLHYANKFPQRVVRLLTVSMPIAGAVINPRFTNSTLDELVAWLLERETSQGEIGLETSRTDPATLRTTIGNLTALDLRMDLNRLGLPCVLSHGAMDPAVAAPQENWFNGLDLSNVFPVIMPELRHFPMLEDPPKFQRLLLDFLDPNANFSAISLKEGWRRRIR
jgi:pimeloyl-ACP methyl ester carboxylesterase